VRIYRVLNSVLIKGTLHKPGDLIKVNSTSVASKYDVLEKTEIVTPSSYCTWCVKAGRPGDEYWLNYRNIYICRVCYAPESFPDEAGRRIYDVFTLEAEDPDKTGWDT
jgi:hypothetical protein